MEINWLVSPPEWIKRYYPLSVWQLDDRAVHLTFDDGPGPATEQYLNWLNRHKIKAVFFVLPEKAKKYSSIMREIAGEGHRIGSHFLYHRPYWRVNRQKLENELSESVEIIESISETKIEICRAPYGRILPRQEKIIFALGYRHWFWSVNSLDYRNGDSRKIVRRIEKYIRPGAVVLMHDKSDNSENMDALEKLRLSGIPFCTDNGE